MDTSAAGSGTVSGQRPGWQRAGRRRWVRAGLCAAGRGVALAGLSLAGTVSLLALVLVAVLASVVLLLIPVGLIAGREGALIRRLGRVTATAVTSVLVLLLVIRGQAGVSRRLTETWCRVDIPAPYRPRPAADTGVWGVCKWLLTDPAVWRDLLWLSVNATVGWVLPLAPAVLTGWGLISLISLADTPGAMAGLWVPVIGLHSTGWYVLHASGPATAVLPALLSLGIIAVSLRTAPRLLRGYGWLARSFLAPTQRARLAARAQQLADSRAAAVDAEAAELSRIERDLHDGAQARLVGVAMSLSAAEKLFDTDAGAARALVREARDSSTKALAELRALVRGIRPPVLADRGLADAIRALALDSPLPVEVAAELPARPPRAAESAAYFAVSELLANVSKHAGASGACIVPCHLDGGLRSCVGVEGGGGADPARGSGLRGVEQRLAAFDGVLSVNSPLGGPTVATLELPCVLSSPKISSS